MGWSFFLIDGPALERSWYPRLGWSGQKFFCAGYPKFGLKV